MNFSRPTFAFSLAALAALTLSHRTAAAAGSCDSEWCGLNSPYLSNLPFHELSFLGDANGQGLKVLGIQYKGNLEVPVLVDDHLEIWDSSGTLLAKGVDLVGASILIQRGDPNLGPMFEVTIEAVNPPIEHWIWQTGATIETYELYAGEVGEVPVPLCTLPPLYSTAEPEPIFYPAGTILYGGERYDAATKTIMAGAPVDGWVNFACAGGATFKLYMNKHVLNAIFPPAGPGLPPPPAPSLEARQTLLKVFTGDLCGTGRPFTQHGVPMHWGNQAGWGSVDWFEYATEAWWTDKGAVCLDVHRLGDELLEEIADECELPTCAGYPERSGLWPTGGELMVSRVPEKP